MQTLTTRIETLRTKAEELYAAGHAPIADECLAAAARLERQKETTSMISYTKYNHLAESGTGAEIVAHLVANVPFIEEFSGRFGYQRACSDALAALGDHEWNDWLDALPGGDLQYEAICRAAHAASRA